MGGRKGQSVTTTGYLFNAGSLLLNLIMIALLANSARMYRNLARGYRKLAATLAASESAANRNPEGKTP